MDSDMIFVSMYRECQYWKDQLRRIPLGKATRPERLQLALKIKERADELKRIAESELKKL